MVGAVDLGGFHHFVGDAVFEEVPDDDHVAHGHAAGEEQSPHVIQQAGGLDVVVANANVISANDWGEMSEKFNLSHDDEWEKIWGNRPILKKSHIWKLDWTEKEYPSLEKIDKIRNNRTE